MGSGSAAEAAKRRRVDADTDGDVEDDVAGAALIECVLLQSLSNAFFELPNRTNTDIHSFTATDLRLQPATVSHVDDALPQRHGVHAHTHTSWPCDAILQVPNKIIHPS